MRAAPLSRIRSTTFSPYWVGRVLTRKSIARALLMRILMRPSWGTRRSEMSSRAITLSRAASRGASAGGGLATSWRMPSVRNRTR